MLELRVKYWFEVDGRFVMGEGGIELLRAIRTRGPLARAHRATGRLRQGRGGSR